MNDKIAIVGAGLAGSEAAWQLAKRGHDVTLFEMRPNRQTEAHKTNNLAELVCSNSFKSIDTGNAHGLLKAELLTLDSLIIQSAQKASLPAGQALGVDREAFSKNVEQGLKELPSLNIVREEISSIDDIYDKFDYIIISTGPLTSEALAKSIQKTLNEDSFYFYDSIAPVVFTESIDMDIAYKASRYDKGSADYINCPFSKEQYYTFIEALISSEKVTFKDFEKSKYFEGCLPIEVMAERGKDTLAFGPMKPVGLLDPHDGRRHHAVLQLRQENLQGSLFNMVGCQTKMTYPEQKRIFTTIPGLENAEFARLGSLHRNTYINAPIHLDESLSLKERPKVHFAGQITGVEGYTESTSIGLWVALNISRKIQNMPLLKAEKNTMLGSLIRYLQEADVKHFQPMNANFGLLESLKTEKKIPKKEKRIILSEKALLNIKEFTT